MHFYLFLGFFCEITGQKNIILNTFAKKFKTFFFFYIGQLIFL